MVARSIRNNNPGNIVYGSFAKSHGATGSDGRFAKFPSWAAGAKAMEALLFGPSYAGKGLTVSQGIYKWAPPSDGNDSGAYASTVARKAGVSANTPLKSLTSTQRLALMNAMARVEGGAGTPSVSSTFDQGRGGTAGPGTAGTAAPTTAPTGRTGLNTNVNVPVVPLSEAQAALGQAPAPNWVPVQVPLDPQAIAQQALDFTNTPVDWPDPMVQYNALKAMADARVAQLQKDSQAQVQQAIAGASGITSAITSGAAGFGADPATLAALGPAANAYYTQLGDAQTSKYRQAQEAALFDAAAQLYNQDFQGRNQQASQMPTTRNTAFRNISDVLTNNQDNALEADKFNAQASNTSNLAGFNQNAGLVKQTLADANAASRTGVTQSESNARSDEATYRVQLNNALTLQRDQAKAVVDLTSAYLKAGLNDKSAQAAAAKAAPAVAKVRQTVKSFNPVDGSAAGAAVDEGDFVASLAYNTFYNPGHRLVTDSTAYQRIDEYARTKAQADLVAEATANAAAKTAAGQKAAATISSAQVTSLAARYQKRMYEQYNLLAGVGLDSVGKAQIEAEWRRVRQAQAPQGNLFRSPGIIPSPTFPLSQTSGTPTLNQLLETLTGVQQQVYG